MLKKIVFITALVMGIQAAYPVSVVPLSEAPATELKARPGAKLWYVQCVALPEQAQATFDLRRLDIQFLEKKPTLSAMRGSRRVSIRKISGFFAKPRATSLLCRNVDDETQSFIIQITPNATPEQVGKKKIAPYVDIRIYGTWEKLPAWVEHCVVAWCVPQRSWLAKAALVVVGGAIVVPVALVLKNQYNRYKHRSNPLPGGPGGPGGNGKNTGGHGPRNHGNGGGFGGGNGADPAPAPSVVPVLPIPPATPNRRRDGFDKPLINFLQSGTPHSRKNAFRNAVFRGAIEADMVAGILSDETSGRGVTVGYLPGNATDLRSLEELLRCTRARQGEVGVYVVSLRSLIHVSVDEATGREVCAPKPLFEELLAQANIIKESGCKVLLIGDVPMDAYSDAVDPCCEFVKQRVPRLIRAFNDIDTNSDVEGIRALYCASNLCSLKELRVRDESVVNDLLEDIRRFILGFQGMSGRCALESECTVCYEDCPLFTTKCCQGNANPEFCPKLCRVCMEKSLACSPWRKCPSATCQRFNAIMVPAV